MEAASGQTTVRHRTEATSPSQRCSAKWVSGLLHLDKDVSSCSEQLGRLSFVIIIFLAEDTARPFATENLGTRLGRGPFRTAPGSAKKGWTCFEATESPGWPSC